MTMGTLARLRKPLQYILAIVAVVFIAIVVSRNWDSFVAAIGRMSPGWIAGSFVFGVLGVLLSMMSWRSVAHAFGHDVGIGRAANIVFISQIGKYIPGGVWPIVTGSRLGLEAGMPVSTTAITLMVQLVTSVATGSVIAVGVLFTFPALAGHYWWLVALVILVGVVMLLPPVMNRWLALTFRLIRRSHLLPAGIRGAHLGKATLWSIASWLAFGVHLWCILTALGGVDLGTLLLCISGYCLAWVAGFLAIITPAGAGVREAVLGLVLVGSLSTSELLGVVLVSRMILIVVDVMLFLIALGTSHRLRPMRASEHPVAVDPTL
jgi:uncharacterized membrane protein YbhN (UPF0104 family)